MGCLDFTADSQQSDGGDAGDAGAGEGRKGEREKGRRKREPILRSFFLFDFWVQKNLSVFSLAAQELESLPDFRSRQDLAFFLFLFFFFFLSFPVSLQYLINIDI